MGFGVGLRGRKRERRGLLGKMATRGVTQSSAPLSATEWGGALGPGSARDWGRASALASGSTTAPESAYGDVEVNEDS